MDPPILHDVDNHFQLLRCEPSHILRYKPHACLCIELPHLTRRLLVTLATRTNIKADSFSLCVPRLGKSLTGCEKGLCVYDLCLLGSSLWAEELRARAVFTEAAHLPSAAIAEAAPLAVLLDARTVLVDIVHSILR